MASAANVYLTNGSSKCMNIKNLDNIHNSTNNMPFVNDGYQILQCNQVPNPVSDDATSMFLAESWSQLDFSIACNARWYLFPNYNWVQDSFGGDNLAKNFKYYSNIIFSNGDKDPWFAAGITEYLHLKLPFFNIKGAAHSQDLQFPQPEETGTDVERVRAEYVMLLDRYIR